MKNITKTTMKVPKGISKKSNLTAEQQKIVRSPAFIAWFGDWINNPAEASKVVDENGEPLVVYLLERKAPIPLG